MNRVPLALLPYKLSKRFSRRFCLLGSGLAKVFNIRAIDLDEASLDAKPSEFSIMCALNAFFYFIIFYFLFFLLYYGVQMKMLLDSILLSFLPSSGIAFLLFIVMIKYPGILSRKKAERIDKNIIFVLKDLYLQINSGASLYNALVHIANANYGETSEVFREVVGNVKSGKPIDKSLEKAALRTKSKFFKRVVWQILNALRAGSSLKGTLRTLIDDLAAAQKIRIRNYSQELNVWALAYMMFAVAIPTLGITFLIILSSFAGMGVNELSMIGFISLSIFIQFAIIGLIKSRRPQLEV